MRRNNSAAVSPSIDCVGVKEDGQQQQQQRLPVPDGLWIDPTSIPTAAAASSPYLLSSYAGEQQPTVAARLSYCLERLWGRLFPVPHPPTAHALAMDAWTRATIGMSSVCMGPALLELAMASCPDTTTDAAAAGAAAYSYSSTSGRETTTDVVVCIVHGFRPSSILTNLAVVSGLLGSILLPLFGACIDHTPYRRAVGAATAALLVLLQAVQMGVGTPGVGHWTVAVVWQLLAALVYQIHLTATLAYVPELTTITSPTSSTHRQAAYNAAFGLVLYVSTLVFLVQVLVVGMVWRQWNNNDDAANNSTSVDVGTARIAQGIATCTTAIGFGLAWGWLFPDRPALQHLSSSSQQQQQQSLWTVGFVQTWRTLRTVRPTVLAVLGAVSAGEAASAGLVSVSTTYCKVVLDMTAGEIGLVFLVVLMGAIPGTKLGEVVTRRFGNPLYSLMVCYLCFIVITTVAATILQGPEDKHAAYGIALLWGVTLGWISPQNTCAFVPLIPADQTTEWMGLYILSTQILTWFPPLLFTILNEHGWAMSIGLVSLNLAFVVALVCALVALRDYQRLVVVLDGAAAHIDVTGEAATARYHSSSMTELKGFGSTSSSPVLRTSASGS